MAETTTDAPAARRRPLGRPFGFIVAVVLVGALLIGLVVAFIDGDDDAVDRQAGTTEGLPSWVEEVSPPPGAELNGGGIVMVNPDVLGLDQEIRLVVDGIDVTAQAVGEPRREESDAAGGGVVGPVNPGPFAYDPENTTEPLVPLDPGPHEAEIILVRYPEGIDEGEFEVRDRFRWEFSIL
ncbi:MAG TPA: hypothetical protein VM618_13290 [Acidimicrobiia bacterium]|nr:hypothetical protein [Acidimicrobiia bacterium]